VLRAIHADLATGASAGKVLQALSQRQARGELPAHAIPSARTISNIASEMRRDDSGPWTLDDADSATVRLLLRALRVIVPHTGGRIQGFTRREARLFPVIYRATKPRYSAWQVFLWTRWYLSWVQTEQDAQDVMLALAALTDSGAWPITQWPRIERVFKAVVGWLPPEALEVSR
jgi:hypothetical protein